ncbi:MULTISPECIES: response regulator transcription factor [unclassified Methylophilus]|jgi:two-component system, NarL family, invasion response regulator UvrY|uniref:response regulator transcription factor n=1 Tax=unclassified Methylophilus TaxID=2630143 RepID=UPI000369A0B5|nr:MULTISPECIES: response regulator transcription factor [unclassified Methylophilus]MBF4991219.1 response regulator transcription factor [Methylophilus sp. QUAN]
MAKVMIADDHAMLRQGLRTMLEQANHQVSADALSGEEACLLVEKNHPDLLILDLDMPGIGGLETLKRILHRKPQMRVLIFSMHDDCIYATRAIQAGARGYVTKTEPPEVVLEAVQKILKGGRYINNELAQSLSMYHLESQENPIQKLSPREFEVFRRIAQGEALAAIAKGMHIGYKTVANIQTSVRQKLGVETTGQVVHIAVRFGIIKGL